MSRQELTQITCPEGHPTSAPLYRSANVTLSPALRDDIVERRFNVATCAECGLEFYADVPFLYHDMDTKVRVWVYPERERPSEEQILQKIRRAAAIANTVLPTDRSGPELVFGLAELDALLQEQ